MWCGARPTLSMMDTSMLLMVTGGSLMPSTQEPSQGAGHTRPVNSGKLFVSSSRNSASRQRPACTSAFHSGILLPSGQPARNPFVKDVAFLWVVRRAPGTCQGGRHAYKQNCLAMILQGSGKDAL